MKKKINWFCVIICYSIHFMNKLMNDENKKTKKDIKQNVLLLTWAPQKILAIMNYNQIQNISRATEFAIQSFPRFLEINIAPPQEEKFDFLCMVGPIGDKSKANLIYSRWNKSKDFYEKLVQGKELALQHRLNFSYHLFIFLKCIIVDRKEDKNTIDCDHILQHISIENVSLTQGIDLKLVH